MPRRPMTEAAYRARLLRAQLWLETHLDEPIDPAALAHEACFSLHHFHRIFRAQIGESVMEHVRRLRLERAARKLRATDARILDLAIDAGYESHEAFTHAFALRFGAPPSHFRDTPSARISEWRAHPQAPRADVRVVRHPALRVAFIRHRGSYAAVGETWATMLTWTATHTAAGNAPQLYGLCPDDPEVTAEARLRFDACAVVPAEFTGDETTAITEIPAGLYAVALHRGSYATLHETYLDVIGRWFPTSGRALAIDAVVEHYLNNPSCAAEADLLIEVRVRIDDGES